MNKAYFIAPVLLAVSACSGGQSIANDPEALDSATDGVSASLLSEFSDNAGVVRATARENGETTVIHAMVPEARAMVATMNSDHYRANSDVRLQHSEEIGRNEYGTFYQGDLSVNGRQVSGIGYEDADSSVVIAYVEDGSQNYLFTAGDGVSDIPNGTYTYRGTNVIGYRDGTAAEDGTFEMKVDFGRGRAEISASTPDTSWIDSDTMETGTEPGTFMTGENIQVDVQSGTFSSETVKIGQKGGSSTDGSLHGSFHGRGATGVTGIYHDNAPTPSIAGAIAGNR